MTQPPRMKKTPPPPPPPSSGPAILSAITVVAVFVALGIVLASNRGATQSTAAAPTVPAFGDATSVAPTAIVAENAAPTAPAAAASTKKTYNAAPPQTIDASKNYTATLATKNGDIVIKLRPDLAPKTVNSFVFLAREGFYDGLTFHRVIPGFVAQGGDPKGDGTGGPGYTVPGEFTSKVLFDKPGILAMARPGNDVNGNGSQFYITLAPTPNLNNQYTIFGEVTQGQDVVDKIAPRDPASATTPGDTIEKITIQES